MWVAGDGHIQFATGWESKQMGFVTHVLHGPANRPFEQQGKGKEALSFLRYGSPKPQNIHPCLSTSRKNLTKVEIIHLQDLPGYTGCSSDRACYGENNEGDKSPLNFFADTAGRKTKMLP